MNVTTFASFTIYEPSDNQKLVVRFLFSKDYHHLSDLQVEQYQNFYLALKVVQKTRLRGKHLRSMFISHAVSMLFGRFLQLQFPVYIKERKLGTKLRMIANAASYHASLSNDIVKAALQCVFINNEKMACYHIGNLRGVKNAESFIHTRFYTYLCEREYNPELDIFTCEPRHKKMLLTTMAMAMPDALEFAVVMKLIADIKETN
jgi:hypothetical protein